jgi:hypothetical protein
MSLPAVSQRSRCSCATLVLGILILPFLTTLLGVWGWWWVEGREKVVGYNPVETTRLGPFVGLGVAEMHSIE